MLFRDMPLSLDNTFAMLDLRYREKQGWMGVEPTVARINDPPTVLKTAEPTRTQPSPQ